MKNLKSCWILLLIAVIALILMATISVDNEKKFISHKVKKGETVSLLCLEIYGHYSKALGAAIAEDNPEIKNINLIYVGQKLLFRRSATDSTEAKSRDEKVAVFQQRVNATQGVITYVEGSAELFKKEKTAAEKLESNVLVYPGDKIKTGKDGRVELIVNRETVVRMKENSELKIEAFRDLEKNEGKTAVNFSVGSVWSKLKNFKDKISRYELELPTAIAGVHGTVYQTTVAADSSAELKVYNGEVAVSGKKPSQTGNFLGVHEVSAPHEIPGPREVSMEQWTRIVQAMQSIKISKNGVPSDPTAFSKAPHDSWESWNEERDKRIAELFKE